MIYYLCTEKHRYTISYWLSKYGRGQRGDIKVLPYRRLLEIEVPATVIFTDFDRLVEGFRIRASRQCDALQQAGCRVLNHPGKSLLRYDLQQALDNDFCVYRQQDRDACRFPVFVRIENGHQGSETGLLHDQAELAERLLLYPDGLIVEYLDSSDVDGVFRKYSAFCIGGKIVPRHVLFSTDWEVKTPDLVNQKTLKEEMAYIKNNPHQEEVGEVFHLADIQYGRIDYSFYQGKMQVWEINTNPMLIVPDQCKHEMRTEIHEISADRINQAFLALDQPIAEN
ncbi:MAG: hypothetical protein QM496_07640 [Verrucomicrobiota bacterium]